MYGSTYNYFVLNQIILTVNRIFGGHLLLSYIGDALLVKSSRSYSMSSVAESRLF